MGKPNLLNIGAAIGVAIALDVPPDAIAHGIEQLHNVPGRFEPVSAGQPFRIIVDYAHTDDALEKVLEVRPRNYHRPTDPGVWLRRRSRSFEAIPDGSALLCATATTRS